MLIDLMEGYYDEHPENALHDNIIMYYMTPDMNDWDHFIYHETDPLNRDPEKELLPRRSVEDIEIRMTIKSNFKFTQMPVLFQMANQLIQCCPGTKIMILDGNKRDALRSESQEKVQKFIWKHRKTPLLPVPQELYFNAEDYGKYIMAFHNGKDKWKVDKRYEELFKKYLLLVRKRNAEAKVKSSNGV